MKELIEGVSKTHHLTQELLEEIVRTDEKQRYSFNEDRSKIRANQGHSIHVDVELEELAPPEYLWHGIGEKYRASIANEGLKAMNRCSFICPGIGKPPESLGQGTADRFSSSSVPDRCTGMESAFSVP